jgi:hypothetical protein
VQVVTLDAGRFAAAHRLPWIVAGAVVLLLAGGAIAYAGGRGHAATPIADSVVELDASGSRPIGRPVVRSLTLAQARAEFPQGVWVGRRFHGVRLTGIHALRWPSGDATMASR